MVSQRSTASGQKPDGPAALSGGRAAPEGLNRAQTRALSRSAPLTPAEFTARGRMAERRVFSLRGVLHGFAERRRDGRL